MIGELLDGTVGGIFRFIGRIITDIVLEFMVRGVGYVFCRLFSKEVDPDSMSVLILGLLIWALIIFGSYNVYSSFT